MRARPARQASAADRLELAYSAEAGWAFKGAEHRAAAPPVQAALEDHEAIAHRRAPPPRARARPPDRANPSPARAAAAAAACSAGGRPSISLARVRTIGLTRQHAAG